MQSYINALDIASVLPFLVLVLFGMIVLMLEVFQRPAQPRTYLSHITVVGFALAGLTAWLMVDLPQSQVFHDMNYLDGFSKVTAILMCTAGALTAMIAPRYLAEQGVDRGEFYALLLFSAGGMITMVSAADFLSFFLALELMSIAIYALAAFVRRSRLSSEAGLKYFLLGAFASAIMLYGIALIYGATGTTNLSEIGQLLGGGRGQSAIEPAHLLSALAHDGLLAAAAGYDPAAGSIYFHSYGASEPMMPLLYFGVLLVIVSAVFKVGAVPFHMWLPDAYTGAPTPVVGFMASAVKAAAFGALVRLLVLTFFDAELRIGPMGWVQVLFVLALLSILWGNLAAMVQQNVKRMLAYSSIAHTGYLLVAITAMGYAGDIDLARSVFFYLFVYAFATLGAFAVLTWFTTRDQSAESYTDLNGLGIRYPALGLAMTIFMFSSAGLPPTAGFIAKFQVFAAAAEAHRVGVDSGLEGASLMIVLLVVGILLSITGLYYYLKVLVHLYMKTPEREVQTAPYGGVKLAIAICAVATLFFGLLPGRLADLSASAVHNMAGRYDGAVEAADPAAVLEDIRRRWIVDER